MKNTIFILFCVATMFLQAQVQPALNMSLVGKLAYPSQQLSSLWGYAAPDGTEYAIVGTDSGTSIVSLANPATPIEVQFLPGLYSIWREAKTYSHYAYISNEAGNGIKIIDLSGLPNTVISKDTIIQGIATAHTISEADGYLYLNGGTSVGCTILDIHTNPWYPIHVGHYGTHYLHDCYVRNDTLYGAAISDGLLTIVDVTNKANPIEINTHTYPDAFTHNTWLNDVGNVCFTTDELDGAYIYAWDVSDPSNIQYLDKIRSILGAGYSVPHNIHVLNDYGVTAYYKDGVVIFDVSHPDNMVEVAHFDTNLLNGGGYEGVWGVYPYLPSGNILVSDMQKGLFVLNANYQRACYLEGNVTSLQTGQSLSDVKITLNSVGYAPEYSDFVGNYKTGLVTAGTYIVHFSKIGYADTSYVINLTNNQTTIQNAQLRILPNFYPKFILLDASGTHQPLDNAYIQLKNTANNLEYSLTTDSNGVSNGSILPGLYYEVIMGKWGYQTKKMAFIPGSATYTLYFNQGYYDDFTFDFGWATAGNATDGTWERCVPIAKPGISAGGDLSIDYGDKAFITENKAGNADEGDVDAGTTILLSPQMDLSNYSNPVIKFYWRFFNEIYADLTPINDHFRVELVSAGQTIPVYDHIGTDNFFHLDTIDVNQYTNNLSQVQLKITAEDVFPEHTVEAFVDLFRVTGSPNFVSIIKDEKDFQLSVFPNPSNSTFHLQYSSAQTHSPLTFEVYDIQGRLLQSYLLDKDKSSIEIGENLSEGLYIGRFSDTISQTSVRLLKLSN